MNYPDYTEKDYYPFTVESPINFSGGITLPDRRVAEVESVDDQIARLEARRAKLIARLRQRDLFGKDVYRDGFVIFFQKRFPHSSGTLYSYAAVKTGGSWWTTGARNKGGVTWDQLLDFIIDQGETFNVKFATGWADFPIVNGEPSGGTDPTRVVDNDRDGDLQANTKE